jgi:protease-4
VASERKTTPERIHSVAQGRVWTGRQAQGHGLVDRLGGLHDAVAGAAERAKLIDYRVVYVEREPRGLERWLALLLGEAAAAVGKQLGWLPAGLRAIDPEAQSELARLARLFESGRADPTRAYAYCFCSLP